MWAGNDSLSDPGALLAPLIARVIELGRGPSALVDWVAARREGQECHLEMVNRLARELAEMLAHNPAFGDHDADATANFGLLTWVVRLSAEGPFDASSSDG